MNAIIAVQSAPQIATTNKIPTGTVVQRALHVISQSSAGIRSRKKLTHLALRLQACTWQLWLKAWYAVIIIINCTIFMRFRILA